MELVYNSCSVVGTVCIRSLTVHGGFSVFLYSFIFHSSVVVYVAFLIPIIVYVICLDTLEAKTCLIPLFVKLDDRHSSTSKRKYACIAGFSESVFWEEPHVTKNNAVIDLHYH